LPDAEAVETVPDAAGTEGEVLPEFLAGDDETGGEDADEPHAVAAE
jgi:hypothetical protein